jgi:ribosomal protein S18 acetylase RimI-like enzyme
VFQLDVIDIPLDDVSVAAIGRYLAGLLDRLSASGRVLSVTRLAVGDVERAQAIASAGFYHVETLEQLLLTPDRFQRVPHPPEGCILREAMPADLPLLERWAAGSFSDSRFHLDPNLSRSAADERYRQWIQNGLESEEETVLSYEDEVGDLVSFLQYRPKDKQHVWVGLGGLHPKLRSSGIVHAITSGYYQRLVEAGFEQITTTVPVQRFRMLAIYQRLGFRVESVQNIFHAYRDRTY